MVGYLLELFGFSFFRGNDFLFYIFSCYKWLLEKEI